MTSQIPFTPLTPEAVERLTLDEALAFEAATVAVANDQKPSLEVTATLVLAVHRLISEAPGSTLPVPASDDTGRDLPAAPEQAREHAGADPREPLVMPQDEDIAAMAGPPVRPGTYRARWADYDTATPGYGQWTWEARDA